MGESISIRLAEERDLPAIVDIYNQAIRSRKATGDMQEFTVLERRDWFHRHLPESYPIFVATQAGKVAGFTSLSPYRPGRQAMDQVAEVSFFVEEESQGKGVGSALLNHVIRESHGLGKRHLVAMLLDINVQSIRLLEKFNFQRWGHLPGIIHFEEYGCGHLIYGLDV